MVFSKTEVFCPKGPVTPPPPQLGILHPVLYSAFAPRHLDFAPSWAEVSNFFVMTWFSHSLKGRRVFEGCLAGETGLSSQAF